MIYILKEITDKDTWNQFIIESEFEFYSFLQSFEWGQIQEKIGKKVARYGIYNSDNICV